MTLRGRLTGAFLAVVLGPVLLGAVFVGTTVATVSRDRSVERLDLAVSSVRTAVGALCRQLRAAAESVAVLAAGGSPAPAAQRVVEAGLATAVHVTDVADTGTFTTADAPPPPWADCAGPPADTTGVWRYEAIAVRVELRGPAGTRLGYVYVAQRLDRALLRRLADASGAAVTLLGGAPDAAVSTEDGPAVGRTVAAATPLREGAMGRTSDGRYVRRDGPVADQPLPLALAVPAGAPGALYAILVTVVVLAALFAVWAAWSLARSTTRPLSELAQAADRVATGDLAARVPVRGGDEVGRLGATFNRMTREMLSYVRALMASRDQMRRHLGVLGDTLASTHDLGRILEVLLQAAMAATGARAGVVLLADPATGVLIGQCGEGLAERGIAVPQKLRVPIGAGLLGGVAATREARRGRVDRDGPVLTPTEPTCRTYVAVPWSATTRPPLPGSATRPNTWSLILPAASGVLALYDRLGRDEFDDADLVTLRTFAGQAAVAVDNVRRHEEAQRLSVTDPLTGLLNYRSLKESLRREVERASRFGRMLGVLALDLDRFKEVNDSYGHAAGDAVLTEFARRIRGEIREVDLAFRQGGEEFVVLLPETDAAGAIVVATRLGAAVKSTPFVVQASGRTVTVRVTVSIGIAVFPHHADTGPGVLGAADDALYAAKAAGRDGYRLFGAFGQPADGARVPSRGASTGTHPPRQSRGG